jgi:hypothetical protein
LKTLQVELINGALGKFIEQHAYILCCSRASAGSLRHFAAFVYLTSASIKMPASFSENRDLSIVF